MNRTPQRMGLQVTEPVTPILGDPGADRGVGGELGRAENDGGGGGGVVFRSPQFPARPTIFPWVSEDALLHEHQVQVLSLLA